MTNSSNPIDLDFLTSVIGDDEEFKKELFVIFEDNAQRNIEKMEDALSTSNNNSWYMASHAFKGASASIGAMDLANLLEHAQKYPEETPEQKTELLNQIKSQLKAVIEFLKTV